jgi:hypothetical protein
MIEISLTKGSNNLQLWLIFGDISKHDLANNTIKPFFLPIYFFSEGRL